MALIDSIKDAITKVIPQKEFMPPPGGTLVHEEDMIISKPTILCFSGSIFFAFLAMCCFASVAAFQAKFGVGPSGLSGFAIFVAVASLLLAAFMLSIPVIYDKYDKFLRLARALQEPRVDFILTATGLFFSSLISLITTISAWTEPGCKDPNKDPNASKVCWIGSIVILLLDWRAGRTGLRRDPAFNPPPQMHLHEVEGDEEDEEASVYGPSSVHATPTPAMPVATATPTSPFGDEYRYRPEAETRPRASMDTYGAFSDPAPQGFGTPISPGVSRTMQYADPYAAVRANISNPSSHPAPPYDYQRMVDSEEEECVTSSPVRGQRKIPKRRDFEENISSRGLLTNVLSYVSREINDFVVSATGRGAETSSSSKHYKYQVHSTTTSERDALRYDTIHHDTPSPPAAHQRKQFGQYTEPLEESEEEDQEAHSVTSSLPPLPASNHPKHRSDTLVSMPGSLFPRSPTPEIPYDQRHVRFASDVRSPLPRPKRLWLKKRPPSDSVPDEAPYIDLTQDPDESEERTQSGFPSDEDHRSGMTKDFITIMPVSTGAEINSRTSTIPTRYQPVEAPHETSVPTSISNQLPDSSWSRSKECSVPLHTTKSVREVIADIDASSPPKPRPSWEVKEKWKAVDQPESPPHYVVSNIIDRSQNTAYDLEYSTLSEQGIEGRRLGNADHTHQYIKELEGKIKVLEDELAKRSLQSTYPPPPPPPPPPPSLSSSSRIPLSGHPSVRGGPNAASATEVPKVMSKNLFPTVPPDKMQAFLSELKTHRLRKVNSVESMNDSFSSGNDHSRTSNESNSWNEDRSILSTKRKRVDSNETRGSLVSALKRKFLDSSQSSNPSTFIFNGVPRNSILSHSRTATRTHGPGTSVDGLVATPSLCSDNDNDIEDRAPMTPPLPPASQSSIQSTRSFPSVTDVGERSEFVSHRITKDSTQLRAALPVGPSITASRPLAPTNDDNDPFSRRRPSSPLPPETPRRPRPPARIQNLRVSPRKTSTGRLQDTSLDRSAISFCPPEESTPAVSTTGNKLIRRKQLTLEDEIRSASSDYGSEELALQEQESELTYDDEEQFVAALEHGTLLGMGQRDSNKGFISHGGGGGIPVFDPLVGNAKNLPEPTKGKKKGRTTSTRGKRKSKRT